MGCFKAGRRDRNGWVRVVSRECGDDGGSVSPVSGSARSSERYMTGEKGQGNRFVAVHSAHPAGDLGRGPTIVEDRHKLEIDK